jgi:anthranilate synthase component 2
MRILLLDNYDSFTFNLVQIFEELGVEVTVKKNNEIDVAQASQFHSIVLSPGPGLPEEAGIMLDLIQKLAPTHHILGVCLGHQAIAEAFGGKLFNLQQVFHGKKEICQIKKKHILFKNIPEYFEVGLYHSWAVEDTQNNIPLDILATSKNEVVLALAHQNYNVVGLQFHPESIITQFGKEILSNWLDLK